MKTWLATVIVTVLAILGGAVGFIGTTGYFSFVSASEGFVATCHVLRIAEAKALINTAQRAEIAKFAVPAGKGDEQFAAYFSGDCSSLPY
jgi:hypothetical protein